MIQKSKITIWRFEDAPQFLRDLSTNGGDEDWIALVPVEHETKFYVSGWLYRIDTCMNPQIVPHPYDSRYEVWIGSHA